jgi:hypothetical protein
VHWNCERAAQVEQSFKSLIRSLKGLEEKISSLAVAILEEHQSYQEKYILIPNKVNSRLWKITLKNIKKGT